MNDDTEILGPEREFQTTAWGLVRSSAQLRAQDLLVRLYWKPLYVFVRARGHDNETAKDLIQDFFVSVLERKAFLRADPEKGRFRTYLLALLKNFMVDWRRACGRQKRGGSLRFEAMDFGEGEGEYLRRAALGEPAELSLDRLWARSLLDECLGRLDAKPEHRTALRLRLLGASYDEVVRRTGMTEGAAQVAVHRLAERLGTEIQRELMTFAHSREELEAEVGDFIRLIG